MSTKFTEYYKEDAKKRRERKSQSLSKDKVEVEQLKKKVEMLEAKVDDRAVAEMVDEKIRAITPQGFWRASCMECGRSPGANTRA